VTADPDVAAEPGTPWPGLAAHTLHHLEAAAHDVGRAGWAPAVRDCLGACTRGAGVPWCGRHDQPSPLTAAGYRWALAVPAACDVAMRATAGGPR
jgi:hypothetical protein